MKLTTTNLIILCLIFSIGFAAGWFEAKAHIYKQNFKHITKKFLMKSKKKAEHHDR
jgi:hypothetical protein